VGEEGVRDVERGKCRSLEIQSKRFCVGISIGHMEVAFVGV
jgi:hypothetical protein